MCDATIGGYPGGLQCVRDDCDGTHEFHATAGADLEAKHHATGDDQ